MILTDEEIKSVYLETFADDSPLTEAEWTAARAIENAVQKKLQSKTQATVVWYIHEPEQFTDDPYVAEDASNAGLTVTKLYAHIVE